MAQNILFVLYICSVTIVYASKGSHALPSAAVTQKGTELSKKSGSVEILFRRACAGGLLPSELRTRLGDDTAISIIGMPG